MVIMTHMWTKQGHPLTTVDFLTKPSAVSGCHQTDNKAAAYRKPDAQEIGEHG